MNYQKENDEKDWVECEVIRVYSSLIKAGSSHKPI